MFIRALMFLIGILLAANTSWLLVTTNSNLGLAAEGFVALVLILFAFFGKVKFIRWLTAFTLALTLLAAGFSAFIVSQGVDDNDTGDEDALIVLGASVIDGNVSPILAGRLNVAYEYSQRNPEALIVVSGGQGTQELVSEAQAMYDYLLSKGLAGERIVMEDKSTSTEENFAFSKAILDERFEPGYKVAFVTTDYHVYRAISTAAKAGLSPVTHLHSENLWYLWPSSCLRETGATIYSWLPIG
jgi:uncharacterized SAM-binding protein YcdF (DUF218 family)